LKLNAAADVEPSQYSPSDGLTIDGRPVTLRLDLGGNVWVMGAIDGETLTMIKIRFMKPNQASVMAKRRHKKYSKACSRQMTFSEACFTGEVPKEAPAARGGKPPAKLEIAGDMEPSQYSPSDGSAINGKPVTLKLDMGGNIWIVAAFDGDTLTLLKIRFTKWNEVSVMAKRQSKRYSKACRKQSSFSERCFTGKVPESPIRFEIAGDKEPSQYSPSDSSTINERPVQLKLDLGGNVWIMARIDGKTLTMVKLRFTRWNEGTILARRENKKYQKSCGKQATFNEACFTGEVPQDDASQADEKKPPGKPEDSRSDDAADSTVSTTAPTTTTRATTTATTTRTKATTTTTVTTTAAATLATTTTSVTTVPSTTTATTTATTSTTAATTAAPTTTSETTTETSTATSTKQAGPTAEEVEAARRDLLSGPQQKEGLIPRTTDHPRENSMRKVSEFDYTETRP